LREGDLLISNNENQASHTLTAEFSNLIESGKKKGFITFKELNDVIGDDAVNIDKLDDLYTALSDQGIEVSDEEETGKEDQIVASTEDLKLEGIKGSWCSCNPLMIRATRRGVPTKYKSS
jgi:cyanate lyase